MADIRAVTVLTFEAAEQEIMSHILDLMQWRNEHNAWPALADPDPTPRWGRINGLANARSVPRAAPETLIAELTNTTPPLRVIGEPRNGYWPCEILIYAPRLTVYK